jgi:hypothetical protein
MFARGAGGALVIERAEEPIFLFGRQPLGYLRAIGQTKQDAKASEDGGDSLENVNPSPTG